jgi:hypothetical protein
MRLVVYGRVFAGFGAVGYGYGACRRPGLRDDRLAGGAAPFEPDTVA